MAPIYRVILGGIHDVKVTYNYAEAKEHFLMWVQEEIMDERVAYKSVMLTADHQPILEYIRQPYPEEFNYA